MQKAYDDMLRKEERIIRELKKELSDARAQIVDVRNKWFQTCEDVLEEKEKLCREKDAQIERLNQRVLEVERQRNEALDKLKAKTAAFYETGTQLEEEKEKKGARIFFGYFCAPCVFAHEGTKPNKFQIVLTEMSFNDWFDFIPTFCFVERFER
jgi:hypothetical protein